MEKELLREANAKDYNQDGFGNGFPSQAQSKLQYTKSSPDFPFGITLKYVWGFKPPEMALAANSGECNQTYAAVDVERYCDKSEI